jgi:site-specific recombinase XerD
MSWVSIRFQNLGIKTHSDIDLISNITEKLILEYINHQLQNNIPEASINRRLSTVRIFFTAAMKSKTIGHNPAVNIKNLSAVKKKINNPVTLIGEFEAVLISEGAAKSTIKNYITDVDQFLNWITGLGKAT